MLFDQAALFRASRGDMQASAIGNECRKTWQFGGIFVLFREAALVAAQ
jgi:hypothetical protein